MKSKISVFFILLILLSGVLKAQKYATTHDIPAVDTINGELFWMGYSVKDLVSQSELIFEGRVLTDSGVYLSPMSMVCTEHRVLVLKQFKGDFRSDTITVISGGGKAMVNGHLQNGDYQSYVHKGDEALFSVSTSEPRRYKISDPNLNFILGSNGYGFVKICSKKDVNTEVYEPIEKAIGHLYKEIHPNNCKSQSLNGARKQD